MPDYNLNWTNNAARQPEGGPAKAKGPFNLESVIDHEIHHPARKSRCKAKMLSAY